MRVIYLLSTDPLARICYNSYTKVTAKFQVYPEDLFSFSPYLNKSCQHFGCARGMMRENDVTASSAMEMNV